MSSRRPLVQQYLILICVLCAGGLHLVASAQQRITGDRLSGYVLPVEPVEGGIRIEALRAWSWEVDDTRRLYLERDVRVTIANQSFTSNAATVWINRIPSEDGLINQIAVYFDEVRNPALQPGTGVAGRDLLVTGSTRGSVHLNVASLTSQRPPANDIVDRGERRLAQQLARTVADPPPPLHQRPQVERPPTPPERERFRPVPGEEFVPRPRPELPPHVVAPEEHIEGPWLAVPRSFVRFGAAKIELVTGEPPDGENTITLIGPITVEHIAPPQPGTGERLRRLTLTADRGVIFTDPVPLEDMATGQVGTEIVRGIYLEGNVIARAGTSELAADDYVVRSPKVYYDFREDRAIMLDAVLRTYSRAVDRLVYARAREMRQIAENQWTAERVRVSTSEFHTPHIAIGAQRMTITRSEAPDGLAETHLDAQHITLRAGEVPFFYWPRYSRTLAGVPLRSATIGTRNNDGVRLLTTWDFFTLIGVDPPEGMDALLKIDGFTKRGFGLGGELAYEDPVPNLGVGLLDLYGVHDHGTDRTAAGQDVDPGRTHRGLFLWEHHARPHPEWTIQGQFSWISDPTFISHWRRDDFETRREYETSLYFKHQHNNAALTILGQHELNSFISNSYLLASRGYQVDRMPEIAYRRYADSLLDGHLTVSSESRVGRMRLVMHDRSAERTGVPAIAFPGVGAGLTPGDSVGEALRMMGLPTRQVLRGDTRHELAVPLNFGALRVTPFAVGRLTAYDNDFESFSEDAEKFRYFGALGATISTEFQRIDNSVESRLLDLHRMRHIIEPSVTVWWGYSNASRDHYPIYDEDVEAIGDGGAVRMGLRNIWQTQRGGPGRWRSVDVLTIDTAAVLRTGDAGRRYPTPQFFDYRPEYSQFADHLDGSFIWLVSDTLSLTGRGIWDLEDHMFARASLGAELRHSPVLVTFVEYRRIRHPGADVVFDGDRSGAELLDIGWSYQLTPKYRVMVSPQWDFREDEFRSINVRVARAFPDFEFIVLFRHDRITDETSFGATIGLVRF